jgi:hypothetical protein
LLSRGQIADPGRRVREQDFRQHGVGSYERQRQIGLAEGELVCGSAEIDPAGPERLDEVAGPRGAFSRRRICTGLTAVPVCQPGARRQAGKSDLY